VDEAQQAVADHGGAVCPVVIHHRVAFQHCLIDGRTAAEFEPGGSSAGNRGAVCRRAVTSECRRAGMMNEEG
jgi:chromosome partitioning protein